MNQNLGKRNKQAVQVLNKVEYDSEGNPIGMKEDRTNPASANFGTEREPLRGGCYRGDGSGYIEIPYSFDIPNNFRISFYFKAKSSPVTQDFFGIRGNTYFWRFINEGYNFILFGSRIFSRWIDYEENKWYKFELIYLDGNYNLKIGDVINRSGRVSLSPDVGYAYILALNTTYKRSNGELFGFSFDELDSSGNYIQTLAKYNCSENSGDVCYDSSGNGHHGTIINAITTTPEENPNSIHQYQDVYSFENEEGYTRKLIHNTELINNDYWKHKWGMYPEDLTIQDGVASIYVSRRGITDTSRQDIGMEQSVNAWVPEHEISFKFRADLVGGHVIPGFAVRINNSIYPVFSSSYSSGDWITVTRSLPAHYIQMYMLYYENNDPDSIGSVLYIKDLSININKTIFPKNSSITLPPFKDVLGNNLQYVGKVPGKAKFVNSSCLLSDGNAYLSGDFLITDTITAHPESEVPVCTIDGRLDFPVVGGKYFDITIERGGSVITRLPLCEPIIDPSNHVYHDVSGNGNHATLINGTLANEGKQDKFHYLQRGFSQYHYVFRGIINSNSYIDCGLGVPNISECVSEFTIEMTINPSNQQQQYGRLAGQSLQSTGPLRWLVTLGSDLEIRYLLFGSAVSQGTGVYLTAFNTYRIKFHYNRNSELLSLYVNDILSFTTSFTIVTADLSNIPLTLGYYPQAGTADYFFNGFLYNVRLTRDGEVVGFWRLNNRIVDPSTHKYVDYSVYNNHGILVNGSLENQGRLNQGDYSPKELAGELDVYGNEVEVPQDSHSFLNTGTELEAYDYPALKQADKVSRFWTDINDSILSKEFSDFTGINAVNRVFSDISNYETVKNIRVYPYELTGRQLNTEKKITNN